jgi:hypothetical protein
MPESYGAHGVDEILEGEIVEERAEPVAGGAPAGGDNWSRPAGAAGGASTSPSGVTHAPIAGARRQSRVVTLGAILVVIGAALLAYRFSDTLAAGGVTLVIGLIFLTAWAFTGRFGLLVPGGVLGGLAFGMIVRDAGLAGSPVALGLGLGFVAIYVLDGLRRSAWPHWWPLVPGGVLILVAALQATSGWDALGAFAWPLVLIATGLTVLAVARSRRGSRQ